jgi:hypothetical protein
MSFRRAAFRLLALAIALAAVEGISLGIDALLFPDGFSNEVVRREQRLVADYPIEDPAIRARAQVLDDEAQALHPYVGYVLDPLRHEDWPVNEQGFPGEPLPERLSDDVLVVAVTGGSVAEYLSIFGAGALAEELGSADGRRVEVYSLALRGFKQPQQLAVVDWLWSQGARFDVLVNLDGFNELVLASENYQQGTDPLFPRRWRMRVRGLASSDGLERAGRIRFTEQLRRDLAAGMVESAWNRSATANLVWRLTDRALGNRVTRETNALKRVLGRERGQTSYEASGPSRSYADDATRYRELARYWKDSSLLLHKKSRAYGFRYLHFLQPNQHVEDSKPMGTRERAIALPEDSPYRDDAQAGYPFLVEAGQELRDAGVAYHDLTMLFRDVQEPVYVDACCHFNDRGNELLAREIGRRIRAEEDATPPAP